MNEHSAILREVLEKPDDDTVRLVFADWLEENGGRDGRERAVFIRSQVGMFASGGDERLYANSDGLRRRAYRPWMRASLLTLAGVDPWEAVYHRGFVSEVHLPAAAFAETVARGLFSRHPVTAVRLTDFVFGSLSEPTLQEWPFRIYENNVPLWNFTPFATYLPYQQDNELTGGRKLGVYRDREYETEADAAEALSRWCVNYGRSLVNPPLAPLG